MINGIERVKDGRGQALSIIGEAGLGKSRLLYEFRKAVANEYSLRERHLTMIITDIGVNPILGY